MSAELVGHPRPQIRRMSCSAAESHRRCRSGLCGTYRPVQHSTVPFTHRDACTSVAPGGTLSILNGVPTLTARWSWTYC